MLITLLYLLDLLITTEHSEWNEFVTNGLPQLRQERAKRLGQQPSVLSDVERTLSQECLQIASELEELWVISLPPAMETYCANRP